MAIIGDALRQAFMPNHEYQRLREEDRAWGLLQRPLVTASAATVGFVVFVSIIVNLSIVFPREASQRPFCRDWKVLQALQLNMSQESELHQYHGAFYLTDQEVVDYYWTVVFIPSAIVFLVSVAYLVSGMTLAYAAPRSHPCLKIVENNFCASRREGNWYCPSCVKIQSKKQDWNHRTQVSKKCERRYLGEGNRAFQEALNQLTCTMEEREYWDYTIEERILLLKFLCDEVLNTVLIREHLDQCNEKSNDLQQKLRALVMDWKSLKVEEEILSLNIARESANKSNQPGDGSREEEEGNASARLAECQHIVNDNSINADPGNVPETSTIESVLGQDGRNDFNENADQFSKSMIVAHSDHSRKVEIQSGDQSQCRVQMLGHRKTILSYYNSLLLLGMPQGFYTQSVRNNAFG